MIDFLSPIKILLLNIKDCKIPGFSRLFQPKFLNSRFFQDSRKNGNPAYIKLNTIRYYFVFITKLQLSYKYVRIRSTVHILCSFIISKETKLFFDKTEKIFTVNKTLDVRTSNKETFVFCTENPTYILTYLLLF